MKIYLFRHGKTNFNEKGIFTGQSEAKLTERGIANAKKVAKNLKDEKIDVAIHTKLSRSKDTLKYVLKFHPECKKKIEDNRMLERSYGLLEGMTHDEFIEKVGEDLDWKLHGDAMENLSKKKREKLEEKLGKEEYKKVHRGWNHPAPYGESYKDVQKRVKKFIRWLKKYMKDNNVNVAISAHGNSIRLFRKIMEKANRHETRSWIIPYDEVFEYEI